MQGVFKRFFMELLGREPGERHVRWTNPQQLHIRTLGSKGSPRVCSSAEEPGAFLYLQYVSLQACIHLQRSCPRGSCERLPAAVTPDPGPSANPPAEEFGAPGVCLLDRLHNAHELCTVAV